MSALNFAWIAAVISAVPVLLGARRHPLFVVPGAILFAPPTLLLLTLHEQLGLWVAANGMSGYWLAMQATLLVLHACFSAFVIFHFLIRLPPSRWELLYVIPGHFFFGGILLYSLFLLAEKLGATMMQQVTLAAGIPFAMAAYFLATTHRTRTVHVKATVPGIKKPVRILQLSDIHVGNYMGDMRLKWIAKEVNACKADIIVATGDFLTVRSEHDYTALLRFFQSLERPPMGIYGCLGNHDLPVGRQLCADLESAGVRMLVNESELLTTPGGERIRIAGLHYYWRHRARNYREAFVNAVGSAPEPVILMCHDPAAFDYLPDHWRGIMLAGHLHGGQIGLTSLGIPISILRPLGMYDQGLFHRHQSVLYAHRGTGVYGFPLRMGVPAEIAVVTVEARDPLIKIPVRQFANSGV